MGFGCFLALVKFFFLFKTSDLGVVCSQVFSEVLFLLDVNMRVFNLSRFSLCNCVRWKRTEHFQKDVNPHFQEKMNFSLKLSSSIKWCSEMMKTNEGTWDNSIRKHQYTIQSQELPWIKTKIYFLSWWLTRQYFELLIISIIGNIWREAFILEIEIGVWKCCLEWRCVLYRNSKQDFGQGRVKS